MTIATNPDADNAIRDQLRAMLVEQIAPQFLGPLAEQRVLLDAMGAQGQVPAGVTVTRASVAGVPAEWLVPDQSDGRVMLHLHGGGYAIGSCDSHRVLGCYLAKACRARLLMPEYRLAPENRFPAGVDDALAVYQTLVESRSPGEKLVLSGDSAGGGLAMSTVLMARERGLPLPDALVLLSPWVDLALTGATLETRAGLDPWIKLSMLEDMRAHYLDDVDRIPAVAAPLDADLGGLPPMLLHVGDHELLLSDSLRLAERARAAGVSAELEVGQELWHVWHLFAPALPQANQAIARIGEFVDRRLG